MGEVWHGQSQSFLRTTGWRGRWNRHKVPSFHAGAQSGSTQSSPRYPHSEENSSRQTKADPNSDSFPGFSNNPILPNAASPLVQILSNSLHLSGADDVFSRTSGISFICGVIVSHAAGGVSLTSHRLVPNRFVHDMEFSAGRKPFNKTLYEQVYTFFADVLRAQRARLDREE